ncbi:CHAT domain-containing protein [Massilia cavernae]|uniref:CHAT domain-containing protein n=1 Tax=Massilia cavernae TaxID=2320864 RepID=A0A418X7R8_9BURK|nr:CHAT domain-containing protein [Massilia cavernae]RJG08534.1 CHAT domain-containing protein [Massilia cavernae]
MRSTPWRAIGAVGCLLLLAGCEKRTGEYIPVPGSRVPGSMTPAPTAPVTSDAARVFYNAQLKPQLARDPANPEQPALAHSQAATLRFGIGPKVAGSVLAEVEPNPVIVKSKEDVPLTVVLHCGFCEPHAESLKTMTFRATTKRTEDVIFRFTPQKKEGQSSYGDKLQITIINDKTGRAYDRLTIPVTIGLAEATSANAAMPAIDLGRPAGSDLRVWESDVILYARAEATNKVTVEVQPVSDKLKTLLNGLALDQDGKRRVFNSGVKDADLVQAMSNSAYGAMAAVSMQGALLKKFSATGADAIVSEEHQLTLKLDPSELAGVADVLGAVGQRLHRHLFGGNAHKDLRTLIGRIEAAAAETGKPGDRPLRLTIVTDDLSLPWQYLHPQGADVDVNKFWGMRFSISVQRASNGAPGKGLDQDVFGKRRVIFAQYGTSTDKTIPHAEQQLAQMKSLFDEQPPIELRKVRSGAELLEELNAGRKEIAAIVTFLHASAGDADDPPYLEFNKGDIVTSDSLENLLNKVSPNEQLDFLSRGPLVILNACETGPARKLPHVKLEDALFQLGAQGVVVTEVSVWINLGHEVATQLLARLDKGEPASDALTAVRRELYKEKANPLDLLYVYYGDPAATLHR